MSITIEKDYIILNYVFPYEISLREIETPADLRVWVEHLREKNWMNPAIERDFIKNVNLFKNWNYPNNP